MGRFFDWLYGVGPAVTVAGSPPPTVTAAAGRVTFATGQAYPRTPWGIDSENLFPAIWDGIGPGWWSRDAAMSLPTISRCRDLICSAVGALPITLWRLDLSEVPTVEQQIPGSPWMERPDPDRTRQWMLAWTVDDLIFYESAHWEVTGRYDATGYPRSFRRILPGDLHVSDDGTVTVNGRPVDPANVVEFLSPLQGLLSNGYRAISIALQLDDAADRFAAAEVPAGWLQERDGGEDQSSEELGATARMWTDARRLNTTAAINKYMEYHEANYDASRMQLVEGRTYQALELARLGNVPPYLVGAPAGTGMTYQNGQQARQDLIDFGCLPLIGCIEQTLSGPNVTPRGQAVRLEVNAWLRNPFTDQEPSANDIQQAVAENPEPGAPA